MSGVLVIEPGRWLQEPPAVNLVLVGLRAWLSLRHNLRIVATLGGLGAEERRASRFAQVR